MRILTCSLAIAVNTELSDGHTAITLREYVLNKAKENELIKVVVAMTRFSMFVKEYGALHQ